MNSEFMSDLVWKSQIGDKEALEQLMLQAYSPIYYLAGKILQNESSARQVTQTVLETIAGKLETLGDPDQFQKWMCRITAARCMQAMPLFHQADADTIPAALWQDMLTDGDTLTEAQSADLIQQMVDDLPKNQRLCILLLGCGGLSIPAIAQLTGFTDATVEKHIQKGQETIQRYLWQLQGRDIQLTGLSSLTGILRIAMFQSQDLEAAVPVVYGILGKEIPVPPNPEKHIIRLLVVVLALLLAGILAVGGLLLVKMAQSFVSEEPTIPTVTQAAAPATTAPTETTVATEPTAAETTVPETTQATIPTTAETLPPASTATAPPSAAATEPEVPSDASATNQEEHTHTHTYTIIIPGDNPSCTRAGKITKLCGVCNHGYIADDPDRPALGHDHVVHLVIAPTATSQGYTTYRCSRCGDSYDADFVDPLPQTDSGSESDPVV